MDLRVEVMIGVEETVGEVNGDGMDIGQGGYEVIPPLKLP